MVKNEVGTEIPNHIVSKAMEMGCLSIRYIYEDGKYGGKCPASNIGGSKSTRFRNMSRVNRYKIPIENNWVIFKSPTYANGYTTFQDEISSLSSVINYTEALHMPLSFDSNWHSMYGITKQRKSAFVGSYTRQESIFNKKSEKFLTFFLLANLDSWQQPKCLKCRYVMRMTNCLTLSSK